MSLTDLFHFLRDLIQKDAEVIAAFVVGMVVTSIVVFTLRVWLFRPARTAEMARLRDQLDKEQGKAGWLDEALRGKDAKVQELSQECERVKEESVEAARRADRLRDELTRSETARDALQRKLDAGIQKARHTLHGYKTQIDSLTRQIQEVTSLEGKIWEKPVGNAVPPFRPLGDKAPPVIALANLKGGVGKTSLAANLAATLWKQGKRVLLVDLDNQASLTHLCLTPEKISDLRPGGGRYVQNVLKADANHGTVAWENLFPVGEAESQLLAADEPLADVEEHAKARWLLNPAGPDVRYVLRAALHDPLLQGRFDVILLDCPPRLGTACINALTACDFVLIPVLLDKTSTLAVPRLLAWLRHLKSMRVCPDLSVLGVVGNRSHYKARLTHREKAVWDALRVACADAWRDDVHLFDAVVPASPHFAEAADEREFAALEADLKPTFTKLVKEIEKETRTRRTAHVDGSRPATVR